MAIYYMYAFLAVFLTAVGQCLLKMGANHAATRTLLAVYLNGYTLLGYVVMFIVTFLTVYAFTAIPFHMAVVILPFTYIFIGLFSRCFFHERLTRGQLLGACCIIAGVIVFGL